MPRLNKRIFQSIMFWFLPLIVVGGLFFPLLGYIVFIMMITMLIRSYFKGRLWCVFLCPRGSFLDILVSRFSLKRNIPRLFTTNKFKIFALFLFMGFFIFRLINAEKSWYAIGFIFVQMCILTTLISIVLGVCTKERCWCTFCPMRTLQTKIASLRKGKNTSL